MSIELVTAIACGYLLGSIPFGLITSRLSGRVDLREYGSGRTGFTNSLRVLGLRRALPVLLGDFGKGLAAALLPPLYTDDAWARGAGGRRRADGAQPAGGASRRAAGPAGALPDAIRVRRVAERRRAGRRRLHRFCRSRRPRRGLRPRRRHGRRADRRAAPRQEAPTAG